MKLIISIGNPGGEYINTRHNAGHLFVDALQKVKPLKDVVIKKSDTFMNESGSFVSSLTKRYTLNPSDLYIVHDDLDIPLGSYKIQFGKGPKDHNGLNDIYEKLETNEFWHIRIGVDNRNQEAGIREKGEEYVLQDFTDEERKIIDGVLEKICKEIIHLLR